MRLDDDLSTWEGHCTTGPAAARDMTSDAALTFFASVLGSGLIAAQIAARAQRKAQFREGMIAVASDFAASTMKVLAAHRSGVTVNADDILGALREANDACEKFWVRCDAQPKKRLQFETRYEARYQAARRRAWEDLNTFSNSAAESARHRVEGLPLAERLRDRVGRRPERESAATRSGADPPRPQSILSPDDLRVERAGLPPGAEP